MGRDGKLLRQVTHSSNNSNTEDNPSESVQNLKKMVEMQKETLAKYKDHMLQAQTKAQSYRTDLENEKRKHGEYISKTDEFVAMLEDERERLRNLYESEKKKSQNKAKDLATEFQEADEEIDRLKTLTVELVEERREYNEVIKEKQSVIEELSSRLEEAANLITKTRDRLQDEKMHTQKLEA